MDAVFDPINSLSFDLSARLVSLLNHPPPAKLPAFHLNVCQVSQLFTRQEVVSPKVFRPTSSFVPTRRCILSSARSICFSNIYLPASASSCKHNVQALSSQPSSFTHPSHSIFVAKERTYAVLAFPFSAIQRVLFPLDRYSWFCIYLANSADPHSSVSNCPNTA